MVAPSGYSAVVKELLADISVQTSEFDTAYDQEFYQRNLLRAGIYFNKQEWGTDRMVPFDLGMFPGYLELAKSAMTGAIGGSSWIAISGPTKRAWKSAEFSSVLLENNRIPSAADEGAEDWLQALVSKRAARMAL